MEKNNNKKKISGSSGFFTVFLIFTIMLRAAGGEAIAPDGSSVGFSSVNKAFNALFPYNETYYGIYEILVYVALGFVLGFVLFGVLEAVKGKSIKAVDTEIWTLIGFYVTLLIFYAVFNKLYINYGPAVLDEGLKSSYPAKETVTAVCIFLSSIFMFEKYLKKNAVVKSITQGLAIVLALGVTITAAFSGTFWLTDIVGGLILSVALILLYRELSKVILEGPEDYKN